MKKTLMKKKLSISVMLACLFALGLAFYGCDNGTTSSASGGIPAKWQGTYIENASSKFTISANSGTFNISGTLYPVPNLNIKTGGVTKYDGGVNGEWVYLYSGDTKLGFIFHYGTGATVGIGSTKAPELYDDITTVHGVTFEPEPSFSGIGATGDFGGDK